MVIRQIKKIGLILGVCFFVVNGFGQDEESNDRIKFKSALSFSAGLLTENTQTINIQAYAGIRPKSGRIELRGDAFYFLNSIGDRPRFTINHQLYMGAFYRFSDEAFQPYLGFQPGMAYSQSSEYGTLNETTGEVTYKKTINPVGSIAGGLDFFAEKFFFAFFETRYIFGKHKSDTYPIFLDEFRVSFGLGFHI